jgi:hypothetical protein
MRTDRVAAGLAPFVSSLERIRAAWKNASARARAYWLIPSSDCSVFRSNK